jgi:hypothetical protein
MAIRDAIPAVQTREVQAGEWGGSPLGFRVRRPTMADLADYEHGVRLLVPAETQVAATRAALGRDDLPPPPEGDDDAARRAWEDEVLPIILQRRQREEARINPRDLERLGGYQVALVCASVIATRIGDAEWEAERFVPGSEDTPDGTAIERLPYGVVPALAAYVHRWASGGEEAAARLARFRRGA